MITLVLGGARSGKSDVAEAIAREWGEPVTYVATGVAVDADMAARIDAHRRRRPPAWRTVEVGNAPELPAVLEGTDEAVLLDALGTWVAAFSDLAYDGEALCRALRSRRRPTAVVSEEVGLGVHPSTEPGRRFRDALGSLNRAVADVADEVLFVIAGRVVPLERR